MARRLPVAVPRNGPSLWSTKTSELPDRRAPVSARQHALHFKRASKRSCQNTCPKTAGNRHGGRPPEYFGKVTNDNAVERKSWLTRSIERYRRIVIGRFTLYCCHVLCFCCAGKYLRYWLHISRFYPWSNHSTIEVQCRATRDIV